MMRNIFDMRDMTNPATEGKRLFNVESARERNASGSATTRMKVVNNDSTAVMGNTVESEGKSL